MVDVTPLVTVSGPPGSGTTTLKDRLAARHNFEALSGGDIFRQMAADRQMDLAVFSKLAEEDDQIDKKLDDRLEGEVTAHAEGRRLPEGNGLVVESRLAGWHAEGVADLAIWLDAAPEVRAGRVGDREETADELRAREQSEANRYESYYGIDIGDLSVYDLVIDTERVSEEGMVQIVDAALADVGAIPGGSPES